MLDARMVDWRYEKWKIVFIFGETRINAFLSRDIKRLMGRRTPRKTSHFLCLNAYFMEYLTAKMAKLFLKKRLFFKNSPDSSICVYKRTCDLKLIIS
ncbi:hypothetical protein, partial [Acetobacter persici]|uniref:hypothetical protein n=1 Tax=Acetobacter persici TaxID=1076596 RepID=UPI0039E89CC4